MLKIEKITLEMPVMRFVRHIDLPKYTYSASSEIGPLTLWFLNACNCYWQWRWISKQILLLQIPEPSRQLGCVQPRVPWVDGPLLEEAQGTAQSQTHWRKLRVDRASLETHQGQDDRTGRGNRRHHSPGILDIAFFGYENRGVASNQKQSVKKGLCRKFERLKMKH